MDTESERIYDRMRLHRLMEQHPNWMPAQLAAALERSERWARKWVRRFQAVTEPSFEMYLSQSRAPKTRSRQTPEAVKDVICDLRVSLSEQYHRPAGARLIRHFLHQDPSLSDLDVFVPSSSRTITRILRERGYIIDPPKHEHEPLPSTASRHRSMVLKHKYQNEHPTTEDGINLVAASGNTHTKQIIAIYAIYAI